LGEEETASDVTQNIRSGGTTFNLYMNHAVSDNGRYVFFHTGESLVPQDTNGAVDAYEYDTWTGTPHLLSSGESPVGSYFLDASAEGRDAFILTQEPLSRWDTGQFYDAYDARVDGGFPEPPAPPASCQGDACQPPPVQLNDATPASLSFVGAGNQSPVVTVHQQKKVKRKQKPKRRRKRRATSHQKRNAKRARRTGR
jgi:hypothetical protein